MDTLRNFKERELKKQMFYLILEILPILIVG